MPPPASHVFSRCREFNEALRGLVNASHLDDRWSARVTASLDGAAGAELRRLVDLISRRAHGAFFTGSALAERLLGRSQFRPDRHFIYDPTAGVGDLLLAAARRLPCAQTASATLRAWGPKAMTVCAAFFGLLPIMWSTGAGADLMKRIAVPMVGGLVTLFALELLVYPAVYMLWKLRELPGEQTPPLAAAEATA
jgi:hypothetical protein